MSSNDLDYANIGVGLRAPRVAIVFDGAGPNWPFFARLALWQATQAWGGAGFILVPHVGGNVSPAMLRAAVAYDPDYVVTSPVTIGDREAAQPGWIEKHVTDIDEVPDDQQDAFRARLLSRNYVDCDTSAARDVVAQACSPHRRLLETVEGGAAPAFPDRWDEDLQTLPLEPTVPGSAQAITSVSAFPGSWPVCLAAPANLGGPLGAAVAGKVGAITRPDFVGAELNPSDVASMVRWLVDRGPAESLPSLLVHQPGDAAMSVLAADQVWAWGSRSLGLVQVAEGKLRPAVCLVVGKTADDFALALALERIHGVGIWIHPDWDPTASGPMTQAVRLGLTWLAKAMQSSRSPITVTSASLPTEDLADHRDYVNSLRPAKSNGGGHDERPDPPLATDVDWSGPRKQHVGLADRYDIPQSVPARIDGAGTQTLATRLAAILPRDPDLATNPTVTWQVDVSLEGSQMPAGRGLDGHRLVAAGTDEFETWVRPSRAGISFHSTRYSATYAAETKEQTLARPQLRTLGLSAWVDVMARQAGHETGLSDTGIRADILARLWGGRGRLTREISGPLWGAFDAFTRSGKSSRAVYPSGEGVLITGFGGVLTFKGIADALGAQMTEEELRDAVDELLRRTILRRGLVIACPDCRHLAFVSVDDLRQNNRCGRCGGSIDLNRSSWSPKPAAEPRWFYDLHAVARAVIADNGHAPLWLDELLASCDAQPGCST